MKAADSSAAIAAFSRWHEHHRSARRALGRQPAIVAHAAFETYSSLTRMPPATRATPEQARAFLEDWFASRWLGLSPGALRLALGRLADVGVSGGAMYDGLIAIIAAASGATLVTMDVRALATYTRVGVDVELIA